MGLYAGAMLRRDRLWESERAQRRLEGKQSPGPKDAEKSQKIGYGVMALIVVIAGAGFSQVHAVGSGVLFWFSVLGIILGIVGVSRNDTKGLSIAAIVLGSIFLSLFLFTACASILALGLV